MYDNRKKLIIIKVIYLHNHFEGSTVVVTTSADAVIRMMSDIEITYLFISIKNALDYTISGNKIEGKRFSIWFSSFFDSY